MFLAYEVLLYLVSAITLPFFLVAGILRGKYLSNFRERIGRYRTRPRAHDLWLHAVSVGEAIAARPVMTAIERMRPDTSLVVTTTTITGQTQARRLFPHATVTYFPFDFTFAVKRFLDHHQPRAFATMETEIWPNATRLGRARGTRMLLANGRISDRSYPRYRFFRFVVGRVLRQYDRILAREELDRERFVAIGAPREIVETTGNVKFDYEPDESSIAIASQLEALIAGRPVIVLGSTIEGEDELLLPALEKLGGAFIIIAPRKPERFEIVAALQATTHFRVVRRSAMDTSEADVLLLDTIGELARVYRYATVAFVGGSLVNSGGHNPIEPAAAGIPVAFGPSMSNFREIASTFLRNDAAKEVRTAEEFVEFAREMIRDEGARKAMGERARRTVAENRGASERTAQRIVELLT
jgi:3-deoxy-D-manno-octulosonic-acid transferase